jgi:outer membrane protein TolC
MLVLVVALNAGAQGAPTNTLTLDQALEIATKNNPAYQQALLGRNRAQAQVRAAYGTLLPSADASGSFGFREGRPQNFGGLSFGASSDIVSSNWNLSANSRISWNTFNQIRRANASLDAADADVTAAQFQLSAQVQQQFLLALQTQARADFQDTLVVQQRLQLELTQARAGVGALMSSMVGSSIGSRRIQQFEEALEKGEFLMMVDVPRDRVEEIEALVRKHHPDAECGGVEPAIPAFP